MPGLSFMMVRISFPKKHFEAKYYNHTFADNDGHFPELSIIKQYFNFTQKLNLFALNLIYM
jgi:hypothetical protein